MRLIDFNLSTADLDRSLPLYWEQATNQLEAIQSITSQDDQLILVSATTGTALTLDQLDARTRQINGQCQLYIQTATEPLRLFGYRLSEERLLFG